MTMKKMVTLVLLAGLLALPSVARNMPQGTAGAKANPGESQIVLAQWNESARKLIAMAEDFPEDKYDYKATPAVRSFAEQLLHAAGAMYYFTARCRDKRRPAKILRARNTRRRRTWWRT